jgi:hypothetical protein
MAPDPYSIFGETDEEDDDEIMAQPRMRLMMDEDDIEEEMYPEEEDEDDDEFYDIDDEEDDDESDIVEEEDEVEEEEDDDDDDYVGGGGGAQTFTIRGDTNGAIITQIRSLLSGPNAIPQAQQAALVRRLINSGVMERTNPPARAVLTPAERAQKEAERRRREKWWSPQLKAHPHGKELLCGGEFGKVRSWGVRYEKDGRRRPRQKESMRFGSGSSMSKVGLPSPFVELRKEAHGI